MSSRPTEPLTRMLVPEPGPGIFTTWFARTRASFWNALGNNIAVLPDGPTLSTVRYASLFARTNRPTASPMA